MIKLKTIGLLLLLVATAACERPAPPTTQEAADAFDVSGYLQQQLMWLQAERPMVLKSVTTKGQPTETVETAEVNWEDELEVFQELDINRPSLRAYYTEERVEGQGGLVSRKYTKEEGATAPVNYLHLITNESKDLQELEAVLLDENMLFYSRRKVLLKVNPATGRMDGYRVEGVQKMIFGDSLHYRIDANL